MVVSVIVFMEMFVVMMVMAICLHFDLQGWPEADFGAGHRTARERRK
ncbi:MAG TPA: hypothetical protein VGE50_09270 [Gammaproteobacteria bacterium]